MEHLLAGFAEFGITGCILGVLIYDVFFLQRKLIDIIESNTKAMQSLKDCVTELKNDQKQNG